ncbi:MAG: selenocysteine-specific translation elongation factor [Planctomycetes bacterium]|nr:selenocysteine-specific translation elongation factor [Planctomycetota bacterium]
MPRHLILGTAGHIDHGKTSLVRALTGIDTDRLPEEKKRGITIDIGFARLDLGDYQLGVVDVPGHERFIKNMLAGATGIDLAMLLVAADDSVMPQTREHLEILQLLGLRHGLVVISKCDLAQDETWLELVEEEVRTLVARTFLDGAPIVRTAAAAGQGIEDLKHAIRQVCLHIEARRESEHFRMAVDRSFSVPGHGTVVTGSAWSGTLHVGDELEWLPASKLVRVRGIQNHDQAVELVERGQRAAINLSGVHHREIVRGHEIATPGFLRPSQVFTVRLQVLPSSPWPVKHRSHLRLHIGTAEVLASVSLLESNVLERGQWGQAQLFLSEPAVATWGQPFVVRSESPMITVGGGQVLQPVARRIRRRQLQQIERLERLWSGDATTRVSTAITFYGLQSWNELDLARDAGVDRHEVGAVLSQLVSQDALIELPLGRGRTARLHCDLVTDLEERVLHAVSRLHEQNPLHASISTQKLAATLDYLGGDALVQALVERLKRSKKLRGDERSVCRVDFTPKLSPAERKLREQVLAAFEAAGFQPPELAGLEKQAVARSAAVHQIVELLRAEGHLVHVSGQIYLHVKWEEELRRRVTGRLHESSTGLAVSDIRDLLGITRKHALPYCEYLDRVGVTRREGDLRVLAESTPDAETKLDHAPQN